MFWYKDQWDEAYDELVYGPDDEENEQETEERAQYFDVPLPYRPKQI